MGGGRCQKKKSSSFSSNTLVLAPSFVCCSKMIKQLIYPPFFFGRLVILGFLWSLVVSAAGEGGEYDKSASSSSNSDLQFLEGCETSSAGSKDDIAVSCQLRTINSEFDKTNLTGIAGEVVVALNLHCSDVLLYQSSLEPKSFAHLKRLTSLSVQFCKLSRLPPGVFGGIGGLRNLTVRTANTAWPALSLDIAPGVLDSLPLLENLDLSANNIWTFPERLFCGARSLEHLNVSFNRIQDISDLSFRVKESGEEFSSLPPITTRKDKQQLSSVLRKSGGSSSSNCVKSGIKTLDISRNRLILLPPSALAALSQLTELFLEGNEISVVDGRAFSGLRLLKVLNLASNKLVSLPASLLQDSREIREIYLQNNSLHSIPPKLFAKLDQVLILDFSYNGLRSLTAGGPNGSYSSSDHHSVFSGLIRLVLLNLSFNRLTSVHPSTFADLYSLQILNLDHNSITSIAPNTFSPLKNLHTLILSHNGLKAIQAGSLNGLFVLSLLSLNNNNISRLAPSAFQNCSSLKDLNLNGNALKEVPLALQNLTFLKTVDLGENGIEQVEEPRLLGLPNLYGLRLTGNRLENLSHSAFQDLVSLKVLNLARNQIQAVEKGAFDTNGNLQAVRLDSNFLSDISHLFVDSPNLIWLNLSDNRLTWFDYSLIPVQLQWLDLHKNEIGELGNYFQREDLRLQTLDASFNQIKRVGAGNVPDGLEMLFLNDNLISTLEPHTFYNKSNLSRVDIFANQIETMDLSALRLKPFPEAKPLPEFYIGGNPILCDCNMEWLQRINALEPLRQHPKVMDLDSVYCKLVYHREKYYLPLAQAHPAQYLCSYKTHCFALCHCCEFDACDCEMTCPANCTCFHDDTWSANIVDCAGKGHERMPGRIPMDATEIYLDGNNFQELSNHLFIGRKNLQVLYLNGSEVRRISNNSFSGLKRLTTLHLENNFLEEILGFEFEGLESLRELYLQANQIRFIANDSFSSLSGLEILRFDGNQLINFPVWILERNPYLSQVSLHNPWSCECEFITHLVPWLQANAGKVLDAGDLTCTGPRGTLNSLLKVNASSPCTDFGLAGYSEISEYSIPPVYFSLMAAIFILCFLLCFVLVAVCRGKLSLRVWAESKCPLKKCYQSAAGQDGDCLEKLYDAYVAYSVKDEVWVDRILSNQLQQNEFPYRLCLHYKDFPATPYMSDKILEAVESSKMTILVLSKNFIQSEWCRFEFKSALHSALRGKRKRLIAVTLGDLPTRDLDPDLRVALRSATILSANDKQFLSKLRAALPPPSFPSGSGMMTMTRSRGLLIPTRENAASQYFLGGHGGQDIHVTSFPHLGGNGTTLCRQVYPEMESNHGASRSSVSSGNSVVPVFVPPYPPPNRPPPLFPSTARGPPPPIPPLRR